jgi:hypothetical protein
MQFVSMSQLGLFGQTFGMRIHILVAHFLRLNYVTIANINHNQVDQKLWMVRWLYLSLFIYFKFTFGLLYFSMALSCFGSCCQDCDLSADSWPSPIGYPDNRFYSFLLSELPFSSLHEHCKVLAHEKPCANASLRFQGV